MMREKRPENEQRVSFRNLFSFADTADAFLMVVGSAGAVAAGVSQPLMTVLLGNLIDSFGATPDVRSLVHKVEKLAVEFVILAVAAGIASFLEVSCWMATGERQVARIRNSYLESMIRQDIAFFDKEHNTEEVVGRMSGDTLLIRDAMGDKVGKLIHLISTFVGGFVVALVRGWLLTLVVMSMIPLLVAGGAAMSTVIAKTASSGQKAYSEASVIVEQTIGSIRTVASFTGEKRSVDKYSKSLRSTYNSNVQQGLASGLGMGTMSFLVFIMFSVGVAYGSTLILDKGYTGARVINVIFAVLIGSFSLGQASPCITAVAAGQVAAFKMFETINRKPEIDASDTKGKKLDDIRGDIEFRDIYFSYPSRPDKQVFGGFSLSIESGSTVAMVGESGSGKSTVISLIERFYDPQAGEVLIDGINLKDYQLRWIRGKIGLVSQEPILFASSIMDNIAYGKDGATIEEIRAAAELANASSFIEKMPQRFDTMVGEHGSQLSGGQKQRVAIARAILKDPRILLLDEATSALDAESERIVQQALDRVMKNRTTVIVAHRLSTIRNADVISVIHRGSILEKGSHSELLMDRNGAYSQLVHKQEMNQDLDHHTYRADGEVFETLDSTVHNSNAHTSYNSISQGSHDGNSSHLALPLSSSVEVDSQITALKNPKTKVHSHQPKVSFQRLAHLNKPELLVYILGSAASVVNGVIFPLFALFLSNVIYTFYEPRKKLQKESKYWSLMFVALGLLSLISITSRMYLFAVAGSKVIRRIRLMTFEKVVNMEIAWFDDAANSSGVIGSRLSTDAAAVRSLVGDVLALAVQNTATLAAALAISLYTNWLLSLVIMALVPLIGLNFWFQMKFMKGISAGAKMIYEEASQVAHDAVGNIRTIASFSAEDKVVESYKMICEGPTRSGIRQGVIGGIGYGISFFLLFCVDGAIFYAAAQLLQHGKANFKEVFRVFFVLSMGVIAISESSSLALDSNKAKSAAASLFAILDQSSKINPNDDSGITLEELKGDIEFHHVSFRYPTRPDVCIFRDLCFTVPSGKTVAFVGESGSGKSTVISLLQRFYDPDSGHVLLDGFEVQKLQLRWLRQQMGLVSQQPTLFNDSIRANISYGNDGTSTEAEIIAAAESANAHKFISSLQQGYDTAVGERGIQLSGGQKQRVAIARAIIKDPKILLLDEATSALDAESEGVVLDALDRVMVNRTTLVIAHRLSTIRGADLIVLIKNGAVIETGDHETLMNVEGGAYASLIAAYFRTASSSDSQFKK